MLYYTIDGTTPTARSFQYTQPFTVTSNTVVTAIASSPSTGWSDVVKRTVYVYNAPVGHIFAPGVSGTVRMYVSRCYYTYGYDCAGSLPYATIRNHLTYFVATATGITYQTDSINQQGVGGQQVVCNASGTSLSAAGFFNNLGCSLGNGNNCAVYGSRTDLEKTLCTLGGNKV